MSSRWRYGYHTVLMHRRVQGGTLSMCDEFGVDQTMSVGVIRIIWYVARHRNSSRRHGNQELRREKAIDIFSSPMSEDDSARI